MKSILWDKMAKKYDRRFRKWYEKIFFVILPQISEEDEILEIGCGSGLLSFKIIPKVKRFVGYDLSKEMINQCDRKLIESNFKNALFVEGDALNPPNLGEFNKILLVNLLHVVDDPEEILEQAKRFLSPDSSLIILSYCHGEKMSGKFKILSNLMKIGSKLGLMAKLHHFTFNELKFLVVKRGFEIVEEKNNSDGFPFLHLNAKLKIL